MTYSNGTSPLLPAGVLRAALDGLPDGLSKVPEAMGCLSWDVEPLGSPTSVAIFSRYQAVRDTGFRRASTHHAPAPQRSMCVAGVPDCFIDAVCGGGSENAPKVCSIEIVWLK